ncbi:MAG: 5'-methylthioadenosine/adenosylhomocysteine nucleosidase [Spirochaetales bacterium]
MTLVLGALDSEVKTITERMEVKHVYRWRGFPVREGLISGEPVVVSRSGVGKSLSAMVTQHLIDQYQPSRIIFTGVAGGLVPDVAIGDMIIASECIQHDMDATSFGFEPGEIPYTRFRAIACDPALLELARGVELPEGRAHVGRILTGDQLVADASVRDALVARFDGLAVEMEGASVGLVAAVNEIPFLLLRTISDTADESVADFANFIVVAAENSWHYLSRMLQRIKENRT